MRCGSIDSCILYPDLSGVIEVVQLQARADLTSHQTVEEDIIEGHSPNDPGNSPVPLVFVR